MNLHRFRYYICVALLAPSGPALAQDNIAVRCASVDGVLLFQDKSRNWRSLTAKDTLPTDGQIVAMFTAELRSADDAVGIKLIADVAERGLFPVLESAVTFHKATTCDIDLTLERGIILLTNRKKTGAVKIRVHVGSEVFDVVLPDAKASAAIERYGRHVPGPPELTDAKKDRPVTNLFFFALEGELVIEHERKATRLHAPPGTALLHWDDATDGIETRFYDQSPEMAKPLTPEEKKRFEILNAHARKLAANLDTAFDVAPAEPLARKTAVLAMGALDDLPRLVAVLHDAKDAETRDFSVLVLRHWLGRGPGQSIKLYDQLTKLGYTSAQAKTLAYLLNGIEEAKLRQPSTYDVLIGSLNHSKLPVRELARWHLTRLVPDGKAIAYDAAGAEPMRLQAIVEWRRLIPEGELPAPSKKAKAPQ